MLDDANTLLILAVILVAGTLSGAIAKRFHLPSVTGQILAGVLMGASVFRVLDEKGLHSLDALVKFALGLMAVAVGSHLNFRRLRAARRRLFWLVALEATLTPLLVFFGRDRVFTDDLVHRDSAGNDCGLDCSCDRTGIGERNGFPGIICDHAPGGCRPE